MNEISRRLAEPLESQLHSELRWEMCNGQLLGNDGAARYYVSVLTGTDQLGRRNPEFPSLARSLAKSLIGDAAEAFRFDEESVLWMWPLFELEYRNRYDAIGLERKWTKADQAVVCRLRHPEYCDQEIAAIVPTTTQQLARFSNYNYLKRFMIAG